MQRGDPHGYALPDDLGSAQAGKSSGNISAAPRSFGALKHGSGHLEARMARRFGGARIAELLFTVEQRDALRARVFQLAEEDERVVAGAAVGSLAVGSGDRFSDLDLTFGIADRVPVAHVLDDWTRTLTADLDAVRLVDLEAGPTIYRVFLLPGALQCDLSMTSATEFRPAGPRFRLLFGETAADASEGRRRSKGGLFIPTPPVAGDIFGWGVIYALHARASIERGRVWQAEHYVGAVRDHALSLACLRRGLPAVQARGYDELPPEILAGLDRSHVGSVEPDALRRALAASVLALLNEGAEADLRDVDVVAERVAELH